MLKFPRPLLIVFDLDNTLYDYDRPNTFATQVLIQEISSQTGIDTVEVKNTLDKSRINIKQRLGHTASSHSRLLYISEAYGLLKLKPAAELFLNLENLFWDSYLSEMELYPGVTDFLQLLKKQEIPLALLTDLTSNIQYRKLLKLGLSTSFDFILTSEEAGGDKSSGLPFDLLGKVSNIDLNYAWFIGDSDHDYPVTRKNQALFFRKVDSSLVPKKHKETQFQNYSDLKSIVEHS